MTEDRLPLAELLQKAGDGDFLRAVAEAVLQILMESDVEGLIGAGRHERSADRLNYRNGYRDRTLDTRLGTLAACGCPKLRQGSYFPPFLEPRKMTEKALGRGDPGGLDRRRVDPTGRRPGAGHGPLRHLQDARSPSSARTSTSGSRPSWSGRSKASGPISGWTPPT